MTTRSEISHIRRCHVCGTVNERKNNEVETCSHCHKSLVPFFYFHPSELPVNTAEALRHEFGFKLHSFGAKVSYQPIYGLFVVWDESLSY